MMYQNPFLINVIIIFENFMKQHHISKTMFAIRNLLFAAAVLLTFGSFSSRIFLPSDQLIHSSESAYKQMNFQWFFVRIRIDEKLKRYYLVGTPSRIENGSLEDFRQRLWWGITHKQLAIGPFMTTEEAENAKLHYRASRERIDKAETAPSGEVAWFLLSVKEIKRAGAYKLIRMPARTATGTMDEFLDALYEGMTFEHLVVGAFFDPTQAEIAKNIYRENE